MSRPPTQPTPFSGTRSGDLVAKRDGRFIFDADQADRAVAFIETLRLRTGDQPGQQLVLMDWQKTVVRELFGWRVKKTGKRRYRRVSVWIPRGNGKTPFLAAIAVCLLFTSGESSVEIYSVAADREQAAISFEDGKFMVLESPALAAESQTYRRSIVYHRRNSSWKVVSSESKTKHGTRPYAVIFDELHTQETRDLFAAFETGLGKRGDSLLMTCSTAGVYNPENLAWKEYEYAKKVASGVLDDPHHLVVIYEAHERDDPFDRATWSKANPGLGVTVHEHALEDEARKAKEDPAALSDFLQYRLGVWVRVARAAIAPEVWERNEAPPLIVPASRVWGGMDVGEKDDLAAIGLWMPHADGTHSVQIECFMPTERVPKLEREHRVPYAQWIADGWIHASGRNNVDTDDIRKRWSDLRGIYSIQQIAFDAWNAQQLSHQLANEDDFQCVEVPQQMKHLSEPIKSFLALLADGKIRAGNNPVLRWMASNLVLLRDTKGNVQFTKQNRAAKIDGIAALINAWSRARVDGGKTSVYETRGLMTL